LKVIYNVLKAFKVLLKRDDACDYVRATIVPQLTQLTQHLDFIISKFQQSKKLFSLAIELQDKYLKSDDDEGQPDADEHENFYI
jgi:hypothetical protein